MARLNHQHRAAVNSSNLVRSSIAIGVLAVLLVVYIVVLFSHPTVAANGCWGEFAPVRADGDRSEFVACLSAASKRFVGGEYVQTKELASMFFTLATGVLVLTISFAEKVVGLETAPRASFNAIVSSWLLLAASILLTGSALALMVRAASIAIESPWADYQRLRPHSTLLFALGVFAFASAIVALMYGVVSSLVQRRRRADEAS